MSQRRFIVSPAQLKTELVILDPGEASHAQRVLRLRVGDEVWLLDGNGNQALAIIERLSPMLCRVTHRPRWQPPRPRLVIVLGMSKNPAMELLAQKFTELMVDEIRPFNASRSVSEPGANKTERWARISQQALKQCGAARAPMISSPAGLADIVARAPQDALKIIAFEEEEQVSFKQLLPEQAPPEIWAIVGPEGGLTAEEVATASQAGFISCQLTASILRSETAALVLAGMLRCYWNNVNVQDKAELSS